MRRWGWRAVLAMPWFLIVVFVVAVSDSFEGWDASFYLLLLALPAALGLAILIAPPGGWTLFVGVVATFVGTLAILLVMAGLYIAAGLGGVAWSRSAVVAAVLAVTAFTAGIGAARLSTREPDRPAQTPMPRG